MGRTKAQRTVLITGASLGIGRALAIAFSRKNWCVALLARNEDGLHQTYKKLASPSDRHMITPCDISMWGECQKSAERIKEKFGHLNLLLNAAFGYAEDPLEKMDPGQIHDFFATSAAGTVLITKACLPLLITGYKKTKRKAQIINIVADWGFPMHNVFTGASTYVAGKYAVHGFGVALQREVAPKGINVTNIYPGIVASSFGLDSKLQIVRKEFGHTAIPLADLAHIVVACSELTSSVVRHLVISPDNPKYNGL
jgi:3-oxoacyl-[acyl-carrier protein] reductase